MQTTEILVIGTNEPILQTIARLINQNEEWQAKLAYSTSEALKMCLADGIRLVLIGAGIEDEDTRHFKREIAQLRPQLPIIEHYGGGSGLLFAEIYQGLAIK